MLDLVRKNTIHYDFDDLKALLNLQCGVDQSGKDGSAPNGAEGGGMPLSAGGMDRNRRQYNEYLIVRFFLSLSFHLFPQPRRKASCHSGRGDR
jgi:exocyst complex component 4